MVSSWDSMASVSHSRDPSLDPGSTHTQCLSSTSSLAGMLDWICVQSLGWGWKANMYNPCAPGHTRKRSQGGWKSIRSIGSFPAAFEIASQQSPDFKFLFLTSSYLLDKACFRRWVLFLFFLFLLRKPSSIPNFAGTWCNSLQFHYCWSRLVRVLVY